MFSHVLAFLGLQYKGWSILRLMEIITCRHRLINSILDLTVFFTTSRFVVAPAFPFPLACATINDLYEQPRVDSCRLEVQRVLGAAYGSIMNKLTRVIAEMCFRVENYCRRFTYAFEAGVHWGKLHSPG